MLDKWRERTRKRLIERLRPGRDEEELNELIERADAVHSDEHRQMLQRLIGFQDIRVREIMLPRSAIAAVELGEHGIRVNAVNADQVDTPLFRRFVSERARQRGVSVEDPGE